MSNVKYCFNDTTPEKLAALSKEVWDNGTTKNEELERNAAFEINDMMSGDASWMFTHSHEAAIRFISQLLRRLSCEMDERLNPNW